MTAPCRSVITAMIAAVSAPKLASGMDPSIGALSLGHEQRGEEDEDADQRAHREEDDPEVKSGCACSGRYDVNSTSAFPCRTMTL